MMSTTNWMRANPKRLAIAALMAAAASVGGCGGENEHAAAIRQAKIDMETLSASVRGSAKSSYEKVVSDLAAAAESERAGEAAAARLIRAQALVRQGEAAATQVAAIERDAQRLASAARNRHDQFLDLEAQSQALKKYDPSEDLKKIEEQVRLKDTEIEQTKASLATAQQELASLRQRAEEAQGKSRAQRDEEMALRSQMVDKSQTQRATLVEQANAAKRRGDGFDLEAADLLAQSGRQVPLITELQTRLQRLEAQKLLLGASREQVQQSAAQARLQSDRARQGVVDAQGNVEYMGAKQAGAELAAVATELSEVRAKIDDPSAEAERLFGQALSEVQRAKGAGGGGGAGARGGGDTRLIEASVHHANADLLLTLARGQQAHGSLMRLLAETQPALAGAEGYKKQAEDAAAKGQEQLTAAKEAFTTARDLYEAAGQSQKAQDVKERLELIATSLAAFANERPIEPGVPAEGGDTAQAPGETPAVPGEAPAAATFEGEQAEVFAMLERISETMKAKNYEALIPMIVFRNAAQEENFRKMLPLMAKQDALDAACVERFGRGYYEIVNEYRNTLGVDASGRSMRTGDRELLRLRTMDPADLEIRVTGGGSEAEVRMKSARTATPLEAMKVDNAWKLKLDYEMEGGISAEGFLTAIGKALDTITENVKNAKYASDSTKMMEDLGKELLKAYTEVLKPTDGDENK